MQLLLVANRLRSIVLKQWDLKCHTTIMQSELQHSISLDWLQGHSKWSGWSSFGWITFRKLKFYKRSTEQYVQYSNTTVFSQNCFLKSHACPSHSLACFFTCFATSFLAWPCTLLGLASFGFRVWIVGIWPTLTMHTAKWFRKGKLLLASSIATWYHMPS